MIQLMQAWLVADLEALKKFYGPGFKPRLLGKRKVVEGFDKIEVEKALKEATKNTSKGPYHKTRHASELLKLANVDRVRKAAPACERLFATLTNLLD